VAPYLADCLASLQTQTFADFEIIAIDDGSVDETYDILVAHAQRDGRMRVRRHTGPAGIVAALQRAAGEARGELLARMDGDDVAHPKRLERQVALLDSRPELAGCGTGVRYFPRYEVRGGAERYERWLNAIHTPAQLQREIFVECPIAHPTLLLRRSALESVGGYRQQGWPEDYDLVLRLHEAGHGMANVGEVLLDWRERPDRSSRVQQQYTLDAFRRCKVHYLRRTLLRGRDGVVVWGAGPVGKAFALELQRAGERVRAFVEVDPCKIGQTIHGAPVIAPDGIDAYAGALCVAAVGQPNARTEIRAALDQAGWVETRDYIAVA
jgi:glycosyltransferase involved in cell wall biosynthesis